MLPAKLPKQSDPPGVGARRRPGPPDGRTCRLECPDNPDGWVTAVRRQPAAPAACAPFPDAIDQRLRDVLRDRGIEQLYTHQAGGRGTRWPAATW
jgi:hypothetical protein